VFGAASSLVTVAACAGLYFAILRPAHTQALDSARQATLTEANRADTEERLLGSLKDERKMLIQKVAEISQELNQAKQRETKPLPLMPAGTVHRPGHPQPGPGSSFCDPNADPNDPISVRCPRH
jgi:hypothetical protein